MFPQKNDFKRKNISGLIDFKKNQNKKKTKKKKKDFKKNLWSDLSETNMCMGDKHLWLAVVKNFSSFLSTCYPDTGYIVSGEVGS